MAGLGKWYYPDEADYSGYYKKTYQIFQFSIKFVVVFVVVVVCFLLFYCCFDVFVVLFFRFGFFVVVLFILIQSSGKEN